MQPHVIEQTIEQRSNIYGPPQMSMENIGLAWTGLIQQHFGIRLDHPIPGFLTALMMSEVKINRSARVFHPDNFVDAPAFLQFAHDAQKNNSLTNQEKKG